MPFVEIGYQEGRYDVIPRHLIEKIAAYMPEAVSEAICNNNGDTLPEGVLVDTKQFSPYAQNQPLVSIRISIKDKPDRGELFYRAVTEMIALCVGDFLAENFPQEKYPKFNLDSVDIVVDLTPRSRIKPMVSAE